MTKREAEVRRLYDHLQTGDAIVESYFTYNGRVMPSSATLYGGGDYIDCHNFGQYSVRNNIRQLRWLLWSMLNIHGRIKWSKV